MPHHKSAKKRVRQTKVKTLENKSRTSETRGAIKKVRAAIEAKDKDGAAKLLSNAQSLLARLAKKGVIKKNNADRRTARLAKAVKGL